MSLSKSTGWLVGSLIVGAACSGAELAAAEQQVANTVEKEWSANVSAFAYFLPGDDNYLQPEIDADAGVLHLELRYNYEDLDTASLWLGYNLSTGNEVLVEFTPMLGTVFGNTNGIAPGFDFSVSWQRLSFYTEFEHVFNTDDSAESFLYAWTELDFDLGGGVSAGLVGQRTRVYDSPRDIQRGLLVSFTLGRGQLTGYVFNPDDDDPIYVLAAAVGFGAR